MFANKKLILSSTNASYTIIERRLINPNKMNKKQLATDLRAMQRID